MIRESIYKLGQAESNIRQPQFEYLQNALIVRYNFNQVERTDMGETTSVWQYNELRIFKTIKQEEVPELMEMVVLPIVDEMQDKVTEVGIQESQKDLPEMFKQEVEYWLDWLFNVE